MEQTAKICQIAELVMGVRYRRLFQSSGATMHSQEKKRKRIEHKYRNLQKFVVEANANDD